MKELADVVMTVRLVDGTDHKVRIGSVTGSDAKLFRNQVGFSLFDAVTSQSFDLDVVAGIVWLSRYKGGERSLSYQKVADTLSFEQVEAVQASMANGSAPPTTGSTSEPTS